MSNYIKRKDTDKSSQKIILKEIHTKETPQSGFNADELLQSISKIIDDKMKSVAITSGNDYHKNDIAAFDNTNTMKKLADQMTVSNKGTSNFESLGNVAETVKQDADDIIDQLANLD
jgi:hypothetical protein